MSRVKSSTSCGIPWSNASTSCRRTTLAAAASWKSCPCCPRRSSAPGPASSPCRTSTAPWLSPRHSQVTGPKWWLLVEVKYSWYTSIILLFLSTRQCKICKCRYWHVYSFWAILSQNDNQPTWWICWSSLINERWVISSSCEAICL